MKRENITLRALEALLLAPVLIILGHFNGWGFVLMFGWALAATSAYTCGRIVERDLKKES